MVRLSLCKASNLKSVKITDGGCSISELTSTLSTWVQNDAEYQVRAFVVSARVLAGNPNSSLRSWSKIWQGVGSRIHDIPVPTSIHIHTKKSRIDFKIFLLIYKVIRGQVPTNLLHSQNAGLLWVLNLKSAIGGRAFSNQNQVWEADSLCTYKIRPKTSLYQKVYQ